MIEKRTCLFAGSITLAPLTIYAAVQPTAPEAKREPIRVIFDTDIWSDIDDALALAMLHSLEDRNEVKLLAVSISTNSKWCASYVDLLNNFYGHGDTPIGMIKEGNDLDDFRRRFPESTFPHSRYTEIISERKKADGSWLYPRNLTEAGTIPESVQLLRKTLVSQPDSSVVVIQVGYSTNLARLLKSPPDTISALDGHQLVARKVRLLSVMGGNFQASVVDGVTLIQKGSPEANLVADIPAAQALFKRWPTPIVVSGGEIGAALPYPIKSIDRDYTYVKNHPIADTYLTYCKEQHMEENGICMDNHRTFDLTSVLYAVRPDGNYFSLSAPGRITILNNGGSRFKESPQGQHRYLVLDETQKARALEAMVMLVSQPPPSLQTGP